MNAAIGRIVHYRLSANDCGAINKRRKDAEKSGFAGQDSGAIVHTGNTVEEGQEYPLVITRSWSGVHVNGQVLLDGNDTLWVTSRGEGPKDGQWHEYARCGE
jgi:hypothetical protein